MTMNVGTLPHVYANPAWMSTAVRLRVLTWRAGIDVIVVRATYGTTTTPVKV